MTSEVYQLRSEVQEDRSQAKRIFSFVSDYPKDLKKEKEAGYGRGSFLRGGLTTWKGKSLKV